MVAYTGAPPFNIHVEIRSKLDYTSVRKSDFIISELNRFYCDKFEYSGTNIEVCPHVKNNSGKDLSLGVGFAYINRSVKVDKSIDLKANGELRLSDSSVLTSSFPMYDYIGFSCGKTLEDRRIV